MLAMKVVYIYFRLYHWQGSGALATPVTCRINIVQAMKTYCTLTKQNIPGAGVFILFCTHSPTDVTVKIFENGCKPERNFYQHQFKCESKVNLKSAAADIDIVANSNTVTTQYLFIQPCVTTERLNTRPLALHLYEKEKLSNKIKSDCSTVHQPLSVILGRHP
jgi:hypothetical protein